MALPRSATDLTADKVAKRLQKHLQDCAPIRTSPLGPIGKGDCISPRPGNLRQNGIRVSPNSGVKHATVLIGTPMAGYGPYTLRQGTRCSGWDARAWGAVIQELIRYYGAKAVRR